MTMISDIPSRMLPAKATSLFFASPDTVATVYTRKPKTGTCFTYAKPVFFPKRVQYSFYRSLTGSGFDVVICPMLGRTRRTTRLDVGLAIAFTGVAFVGWSVVAGISRWLMQNMMSTSAGKSDTLPYATKVIKIFFVETGIVIDFVGLAWLILTLALIYFANRQRIGISWAWMSAMLQAIVGGGGALLVSWAVYKPHIIVEKAEPGPLARLSMISLPIVITIAVVIWAVFVVKMLSERNRTIRRGPSLTDGLRTNR